MNTPALPGNLAGGAPAPDSSAGMELQLRDIHLPDAISWWPVAPGWWLLLLALLIAIVLIVMYRRKRIMRALKREIRQQLQEIRDQHRQSGNKVHLVRALSELLRRASLHYYPAQRVAGISGNDWLDFLAYTHKAEKRNSFRSAHARLLITAPYLASSAEITLDDEQLLSLVESWLLQTHRSAMLDAWQARAETTRADKPKAGVSA